MLPFLKNKEGAASAEIEIKPMGNSDEDYPYDMLDAITDDLMHAITKRDKALLRDSLEALCQYIRDEDEEQDESM